MFMPEENLVNKTSFPSSSRGDQFLMTRPAHFLLLNRKTTSKFKFIIIQLKKA